MVLAPWSQLDAEAVLSLMAQACLEQLDRHRLRHPARLHRYKRSWYRDPARSSAASKPQQTPLAAPADAQIVARYLQPVSSAVGLMVLAHPTISPEHLAREGCVVRILMQRSCR